MGALNKSRSGAADSTLSKDLNNKLEELSRRDRPIPSDKVQREEEVKSISLNAKEKLDGIGDELKKLVANARKLETDADEYYGRQLKEANNKMKSLTMSCKESDKLQSQLEKFKQTRTTMNREIHSLQQKIQKVHKSWLEDYENTSALIKGYEANNDLRGLKIMARSVLFRKRQLDNRIGAYEQIISATKQCLVTKDVGLRSNVLSGLQSVEKLMGPLEKAIKNLQKPMAELRERMKGW